MRRNSCCFTDFRARVICSVTSSRSSRSNFAWSRRTCPGSVSRTCRAATSSTTPSTTSPRVMDRFTEVVGLKRFAVYVFDYGAPTGFRLAVKHPERIAAIISQNGNAYEEGLSEGWTPIRAYWTGAVGGEPEGAARVPLSRNHDLAVHAGRFRHDPGCARRIFARQLLPGAAGRGRDPARSFRRLQEQRRALSRVSKLLPQAQAAVSGRMGQERSLLPAGRRGGVQTRHAERGHTLLRYRPLRARDTLRRNRRGYRRISIAFSVGPRRSSHEARQEQRYRGENDDQAEPRQLGEQRTADAREDRP